jgi:hypothetical protein
VPEIYNWFIKPLHRSKPAKISSDFWNDLIFALEGRDIKQYEVLEGFSIPGKLQGREAVKVEHRGVKPGDRIFIRTDRASDYFDIENPVDVDQADRVFRARKTEWFPLVMKKVREIRGE